MSLRNPDIDVPNLIDSGWGWAEIALEAGAVTEADFDHLAEIANWQGDGAPDSPAEQKQSLNFAAWCRLFAQMLRKGGVQ